MKPSVPTGMKLRHVYDAADHAFLVALHNDPVVLHNTRDPRPITLEGHMAWWDRVKDDPKECRLIFEVNGARVGFTKFYGIDHQNHHCTLGADIYPTYRGKGLAKHMWALMLDQCFDDEGAALNAVRLSTMEHNAVARRVYEGLGFKVEGKIHACHYRDGMYDDAVCMYMLRDWWVDR